MQVEVEVNSVQQTSNDSLSNSVLDKPIGVTLGELLTKVEQWAEDRNIIKGTEPIDQAMKLFSEFGELSDNIGKGRDCRDDIGDVLVVLTIMSKQAGVNLRNVVIRSDNLNKLKETHMKNLVVCVGGTLVSFCDYIEYNPVVCENVAQSVLRLLHVLAEKNNTTLTECLSVAYNDIKDRKGVVYNGVFIKESDPAYQDALKALGK